jgi:hypothetical protein
MKTLVILTFLLCSIVIQNSQAQKRIFERMIIEADSLWKINELNQAIVSYKNILSGVEIPEEYQSLVYLRLAEVQYQSGLSDESSATISKMKLLPYLPDHHLLIGDELQKKIKGIPVNDKTPVNDRYKTVARIFVSDDTKKNVEMGVTCKTIEDALKALLVLKKKNLPEGAVEIIITGGICRIDKTIAIGAQYSGTERNPLIIRSSSPENRVIFTGGVQLKYWKKEKDVKVLARLPENSRNHVIVADLGKNGIDKIDTLILGGFSSKRAGSAVGSRSGSLPVSELFYKGEPQMMARWPNDKDTLVPITDFKNSRVLNWAPESDLWMHGYWKYMWADAYEKVKSISVKDTVITLQPPLNNYGFGKSKWHIVNALSEIDIPGEWCISAKENKIWYYPPADFNPDDCILSVNGLVFSVENCDYLTVKDIDTRYFRGDGMVFFNCNHLSLLHCSVRDGSGYGIRIIEGKNHLVHSCLIESMGRGGIEIISGNISRLENSGSIIENCRIRDLSRIDRTYTPAILLEGVGIKVRHCLFSEIPSSAIRLEGNDMLIEMNEFARCVIESDDQGAIDVFGNPLYRGNIIRWNFFHDIGIAGLHMAAGIRLDDAICGFSIYENLFLRSSNDLFGGIQVHGGNENYIEGNIFIDCHAAISQSAWGDKRWKTTLTEKDHPVSIALKFYDWQSDLWQKRYPALKHLAEGGTDRNFAVGNLMINGQSFFLRNSPKFQSFNNTVLTKKLVISKLSDFKEYFAPWQSIPLQMIGPSE